MQIKSMTQGHQKSIFNVVNTVLSRRQALIANIFTLMKRFQPEIKIVNEDVKEPEQLYSNIS